MQKVYYEWDIETVDGNNPFDDDADITDHNFSDKFPGVPEQDSKEECYRVVLVRDFYKNGELDRSWAYLDKNGKLPEYFKDAYDKPTCKVPQRFHNELKKGA